MEQKFTADNTVITTCVAKSEKLMNMKAYQHK